MMLSRLNLALAAVFVMMLVLLMLLRADNSQPNFQVKLGNDMTHSPAYTTYSPNDNFPNGRTWQDPVPGTIAREEQTLHYRATPADALRAGEELSNPIVSDAKAKAASIERGRVSFRTFCVACHGGDGAGNGLVAQRGFPPPPSLLTGKSREMKDGQLFHILTYGQNSMPQFAAQIPPAKRWDVINYIRSLQKETPPPNATLSATPQPEMSNKAEAKP